VDNSSGSSPRWFSPSQTARCLPCSSRLTTSKPNKAGAFQSLESHLNTCAAGVNLGHTYQRPTCSPPNHHLAQQHQECRTAHTAARTAINTPARCCPGWVALKFSVLGAVRDIAKTQICFTSNEHQETNTRTDALHFGVQGCGCGCECDSRVENVHRESRMNRLKGR
jgi:hypothetical protein